MTTTTSAVGFARLPTGLRDLLDEAATTAAGPDGDEARRSSI